MLSHKVRYALTIIGSVIEIEKVMEEVNKWELIAAICFINNFHQHFSFINAFV